MKNIFLALNQLVNTYNLKDRLMLDNNYDDLGIEALEELRREKELNSGKEISEKDRKHSSNL